MYDFTAIESVRIVAMFERENVDDLEPHQVKAWPVPDTGGCLFVHQVPTAGDPDPWGITQVPSGLSISAPWSFSRPEDALRAAHQFWRALRQCDRETLQSQETRIVYPSHHLVQMRISYIWEEADVRLFTNAEARTT